jgi:hypothetical protein
MLRYTVTAKNNLLFLICYQFFAVTDSFQLLVTAIFNVTRSLLVATKSKLLRSEAEALLRYIHRLKNYQKYVQEWLFFGAGLVL